jgi:murein tripeptide amidase MpaA
MWITAAFDGGNIEVDRIEGTTADLRIRPDTGAGFYQWFYFAAAGPAGESWELRITNAGGAAFPKGWEDYRAVASYDRKAWFRVPTDYADGTLTIRHTPEAGRVFYAYFAPYPMERHHDLIARCTARNRAAYEVLGQTLDGQDIDLLRVGTWTQERLAVWVIGRQHPGETMAEHWMEGFLDRLLDPEDPVPPYLLERCVFYVVPNMNPDGSRRGHLRTNAAGVNLNREWQAPSLERSPEVHHVRERMYRSNCAILLDVHGDEALPYNFAAGFEGIPNLRAEMLQAFDLYTQRLAELNPDFQREHGYGAARPGHANLSVCTPFMAEHFGAIAFTLEMPFKDTAQNPHPRDGWSPARSRALGRSCLNALRPLVDRLRS